MSNSPIVRDVLDNGLRLLTERMTQVRSVSIGVWLTRGSRHETAERERHRAFRRAHALQGHRDADRPRTSRRRSIRSAASSTRSPRRNTRATTSRCSTSTCRSPSTSSPTSSCNPAFSPDDIEREKKVVLEEIKMVEDTPDDLVHELFTQGFWENHPLGRPILGTQGDRRVVRRADCCATTSRNAYTPREPDRVGGRQSRARARARAGRGEVRVADAGRRAGRSSTPPTVVPKILIRNKELEQSHVCLGVEQLSAEPRRSLFELRAEHAARRLDELAAVPERPREARPGLRGVQRPERVSRRRLVHDLRRLRERRGRRGDRPRASRSCAA